MEVVLTPVAGRSMDQKEIAVFEERAEEWLGAILRANNPPIVLDGVKVVGQSVASSSTRMRRRLQIGDSSSSSVIIDMETKGTLKPTGNFFNEDNIDFDSIVTRAITNGSENLVTELRSDTSIDYFDTLTSIQVVAKQNPNNISGGNGSNEPTNSDNKSKIIIAISASAGAALLFAVSLYAYKRNRR